MTLTPQAPFLIPTLPLARVKHCPRGVVFSCVRDKSSANTLPFLQCTAGCAGSRSNYTANGAVCLLVCKTPLYSTPPTPTQCKAGYNGTGSNCTACAAGTYKNFMGSGGCCCPLYHVVPVAHVLILSDASDALGHQYPAPYIRTPPPQRIAQKSVSKTRNPNPKTPNPKFKPQTPNPKPQPPHFALPTSNP